MFREALPVLVRNHIAELKFNSDTYVKVFERADQVYDSNQSGDPKAVAAVSVSSNPSSSSSTEVAATSVRSRNRGGNNKNKNQRNQNSSNQRQRNTANTQTPSTTNQPTARQGAKPKGPRHATAKGDNLCNMHHKWGENSNFCAQPWSCPMKDQWKAPQ